MSERLAEEFLVEKDGLPLHLQRAYRSLGYGPGDFPVAEAMASRLLSLPMYPEISHEQIEFVADRLRAAVA